MEVLAVYTNKTPLAAYRGAGRPEGIFFIERMMDLLADELGMDPAELRLRNMIKPEAMPYKNCFGWQYDSGDYPGTLKRGLKLLRLRELESWVEEESRKGRMLGLGYAFYVEITSGGPFETAKVSLGRDGTVSIVVGSTPTGQGDATGFAQIAADLLGVDVGRVRVYWGDTGLIGEGVGTFGSRTITVGGGAVIEAVSEVLEGLRAKAAEMLGVEPERSSTGRASSTSPTAPRTSWACGTWSSSCTGSWVRGPARYSLHTQSTTLGSPSTPTACTWRLSR